MNNKRFQSTCWKHFRDLNSGDTQSAKRAMNDICQTYWQPLHHFALSLGCNHEDAEDCVQGFLAKSAENGFFALADPEKGRIRSYLLIAFKRYIYDIWKKGRALKRGGGSKIAPLNSYHQQEIAEEPSLAFDQQWALAVIVTAKKSLEIRYCNIGKESYFSELEGCLDGSALADTTKTAKNLNISTATLKTVVFRIRQRFGEEVRKAVMETVANENDIDDEIRWLITVLKK